MDYDIGVQVYSYRDFTLEAVCAELRNSPIRAIELMETHLPTDSSSKEVIEAKERLNDVDIKVRGYYGGSFESETFSMAKKRFEFAAELGADYITCDFPPEPELIDDVAELAERHNLLVAVHNHGPGARYETMEDVQRVVTTSPASIGACVDTGHFLRVNETPETVIPALGEHIHAVHVKDFLDSDTEVVPEQGRLDLEELVSLLDAHSSLSTPLTIEYEGNFEDPSPGILRTANRLFELMA